MCENIIASGWTEAPPHDDIANGPVQLIAGISRIHLGDMFDDDDHRELCPERTTAESASPGAGSSRHDPYESNDAPLPTAESAPMGAFASGVPVHIQTNLLCPPGLQPPAAIGDDEGRTEQPNVNSQESAANLRIIGVFRRQCIARFGADPVQAALVAE